MLKEIEISIHAPVKGATLVVCDRERDHIYFNPRTREGCDSVYLPPFLLKDPISIHAPVKGATRLPLMRCHNIIIFQSTHP